MPDTPPCGAAGPDWACTRDAVRTVNGEPRCATCGPSGHDPFNAAGATIGPLFPLTMKRTKIDGATSHMKLAETIEGASPGDVIEVGSWHARADPSRAPR